jgi:hypothetical protein
MALVIGVPENGDFFLNDVRVVLTEIISDEKFKIMVPTPGMDYQWTVTSDRAAVLAGFGLPGTVRISSGLRGSMETARVAIEAPKSVEVLRGSLYRKGTKKKAG